MNKQQLIDYLNLKYEALEFWNDLRYVTPSEQKICFLNYQIRKVKKMLKDLEVLSVENEIKPLTYKGKSVNCPECGEKLQPEGGCLFCPICGWSACK
jgi:ribonucleoside-diphosphate reductase alpha chain